jgi:hypothetical protein
VQEACELVALDIYTRAEESGAQITLALVEQRLTELLAGFTTMIRAIGARCDVAGQCAVRVLFATATPARRLLPG